MALLGPHFAMNPKHVKFANANTGWILQDLGLGCTSASHNFESDHRQLQSCVMNGCERTFLFMQNFSGTWFPTTASTMSRDADTDDGSRVQVNVRGWASAKLLYHGISFA